MFPGQGDDFEKVFIFKMSEIGSSTRVDLVRQMQPRRDLEHAWIMFDHVKRITNWTIWLVMFTMQHINVP